MQVGDLVRVNLPNVSGEFGQRALQGQLCVITELSSRELPQHHRHVRVFLMNGEENSFYVRNLEVVDG